MVDKISGVNPKSKRYAAIVLMRKHEKKPMSEVIPLLVKECEISEANAKGYYRWLVANGYAPGVVPGSSRQPIVQTTVRSAAPAKADSGRGVPGKTAEAKTAKAAAAKPQAKGKAAAPAKSPEETAAIKAKNAARMKVVTAAKKAKAAPAGE